MEDCSTFYSVPFGGLTSLDIEAQGDINLSVATDSQGNLPGPKESTLAALRSFARAYRGIRLTSMPQAPGFILN